MATVMVMASPISTSAFLCTSFVSSKSAPCSLSPFVSHRRALPFRFPTWFLQLGPSIFSQWSGLKHLGISIKKEKVVHAYLFGVGAPEALVIGVVALLVFGPKGLAEVARNLGKTLRAFQPTIRELQEVSMEFKSTLEREIGLDEFPLNLAYISSSSLTLCLYYLKITEEQLKASASASKQQGQTASPGPQHEHEHEHEATPKETGAAAMPPISES
ncbi:hypothetical protein V6N11_068135 [Hibiscus sabdariffa]|uniref:Sec-independent protein translocase protein TATB, chloroplastic n=1 Tax=Hibiscus sabdariffa TaxID=183260 RepID=A0ABR2STR3_9ROSI